MSTLTPYLMVENARPFVDFVENALDADVAGVVHLDTNPERVVHAEARIGASVLYFADAGPDGAGARRFPPEPAHLQLWLTVPDAEATYDRAIARGASPAMEVATQDDGSRVGGFVAFGTLWWVTTAA